MREGIYNLLLDGLIQHMYVQSSLFYKSTSSLVFPYAVCFAHVSYMGEHDDFNKFMLAILAVR